MSIPYSASPYSSAPSSPSLFTSYSSPRAQRSYSNLLKAPTRPIICYSCGQSGRISPYCPSRPKT